MKKQILKYLIHKTGFRQNKGFTLIEILIVISIISIIIGAVSLSINAARPSIEDAFFNKLKIAISASRKFSQNYNKSSKFSFDYKKKKINFYWLNSTDDKWYPVPHLNIKTLDFKDLEITSVLQEIIMLPNGFIDDSLITISNGDINLELSTGIKKEE